MKLDQARYYDDQYRSGQYADLYREHSPEASAADDWHVGLVCAALTLRPARGPVLDLGSGRGFYLRAWSDAGFDVRGRDISAVAVEDSPYRDVTDVGDAADLSQYADDQFQLVFSSALLEHMTDDQVSKLARGALRVARYSVHYIAHERGADPGHINIKTRDEWLRFFYNTGVPFPFSVVNPLFVTSPLLILSRDIPITLSTSIATANNAMEKRT
jgi:hypothetical protein